MERKPQNFTLPRRKGSQSRTRSNSVHPLVKQAKCRKSDGSSDDNKSGPGTSRPKSKYSDDSFESETMLAQLESSADDDTSSSEQRSIHKSRRSNSSNGRAANKEKLNFRSSSSAPRGEGYRSTRDSLKAELDRCKKELNDHSNATKELEQKYKKINVELSDMQEKHKGFLAKHSSDSKNSEREAISSDCSLQQKFTQIFERNKRIHLFSGGTGEPHSQLLPLSGDDTASSKKRHATAEPSSIGDNKSTGKNSDNIHNSSKSNSNNNSISNYKNNNNDRDKNSQIKPKLKSTWCNNRPAFGVKEVRCKKKCSQEAQDLFETPVQTSSERSKSSSLERIYQTIQEAICSDRKDLAATQKGLANADVTNLKKAITDLQSRQAHLCMVIDQQQDLLKDYQSRCAKAKRLVDSQRLQLDQLTQKNQNLQEKVQKDMNELRQKLDSKLEEMAPLSKNLSDVQSRYGETVKQNRALIERIRVLQKCSKELKLKMEDLTERKSHILAKLKNAERDIRVTKNFNRALRAEKQKHVEEIQKLREQLENQKVASKRAQLRQREASDRECRELQRRIYQLEQKLARCNTSTSGVLQQRDRLISELQSQINSLVSNFEVSQKHIRKLRRDIGNAADTVENKTGTTTTTHPNHIGIMGNPRSIQRKFN